ncbi:MAG: hypothetical protein DMG79_05825 [Acidobacteria bacterium]|nr:MAG: hypothetical protein DMG79_05825 [Acidobacteriota bacterium]
MKKRTARTANKVQDATGQLSEVMQDATDGLREFGQQVQSGVSRVNRQLQSRISRVDESTIPDTFSNAPKLISPRVHAWLDLAVTGYFAILGTWCALRGKRGAATAAFVNAGMVAGVSLLTDYEGTGEKPISFKMHGTLDAVQATKAALAPILYGFEGEPESLFFYGQAANEVAVIASTDWDEGMPSASRRKAA